MLAAIVLFLSVAINGDVPFPKHIEPMQYPVAARLAHWDGVVNAHVTLDSDGKVLRVGTQGRQILADAVQTSIKKWTFYVEEKKEIDITVQFKFVGDPLEFNAKTLITYDLPT